MEEKFVAISPIVKIIPNVEPANSNDRKMVSTCLNSPQLKCNGNQIHALGKESSTLSFVLRNKN